MSESLLTIKQLAARLNISARAIYRLADSGRIPRPVKLGHVNRWRSDEVEQWIADGCPSCTGRGAQQ